MLVIQLPRRGILVSRKDAPSRGPCKHLHEFEGPAGQSTRPDANGYPARGTCSCFGISTRLWGQSQGWSRGGQFFLNQEQEWIESWSNYSLCLCELQVMDPARARPQRRRRDTSSIDNEDISFDAGSWVPKQATSSCIKKVAIRCRSCISSGEKSRPALPAQQHTTYNSHIKTCQLCPSFLFCSPTTSDSTRRGWA